MSYDRFKAERESREETRRMLEEEYDRRNLDEWGDPKLKSSKELEEERYRQLYGELLTGRQQTMRDERYRRLYGDLLAGRQQGLEDARHRRLYNEMLVSRPQAIVEERNRQQAEKWGKGNSFLKGLSQMNLSDWLDVGGQALQGAERVASGATFGAYDWLNRQLGGNYAERKQRLQESADSAGIGLLNELTGAGLEIAGNIAGGGGVLGKGLSKAGLKGVKLSTVGGGIDGMLNAGFATENLADLPQNLLLGGATGALTSYGLDKAMNKGMQKATSAFKKYVPVYKEIETLKNNSVRLKDFNKSMEVARSLRAQNNIPTKYPKTFEEAQENALAYNRKYYDKLAEKGDLEILDIQNKLEKIPATKIEPLDLPNEFEYAKRLQLEAKKAGLQLFGHIDHFLKDGRGKFVNMLSRTHKAPDFSLSKGTKDDFVNYTVRKYETPRTMYDLLIRRDNDVLFNKFASDKPRYIAEQFTGPGFSLRTKFVPQEIGIMKSGDKLYLSKLRGYTERNPMLKNKIENIRKNSHAYDRLPDTDFRVLADANRQIANYGRANKGTDLGREAIKTSDAVYQMMDEIVPGFAEYRGKVTGRTNREFGRYLATKPLEIYDAINNLPNVSLPKSIPIGVGGDLQRNWGK